MATVTDPIMTDATGQDIVDKLGELASAVKPNASDIPLTPPSGMTATNVQDGISELKQSLSDFETLEKKASGAIATFDDGSDLPMPRLEVTIEPQQDLHGYDNPWAGGSGKNKLPMTVSGIKSANTSGTWSGNDYTLNSVTFSILTDSAENVIGFKVNGTANGDSPSFYIYRTLTLPNDNYIVSGCPNDGSLSTYGLFIDYSSGGNIPNYGGDTNIPVNNVNLTARIRIQNGYQANNITFYPMIRLSTEQDATFASYTNICPISGWDEANVTVCGTNIWDEEWELGSLNLETGAKTNANNLIRSKNFIPIKSNTNYYFKYFASALSNSNFYICFYDSNKQFLSSASTHDTVTTPLNAYFMLFRCHSNYGTTYNNDISINYPSTDTSYHAYNGHTYTIDLDGTRYGGEVDVVSGSGTDKLGYVDLGDLYWVYDSDSKVFTASIQGIKSGVYTDTNLLSSIYPVKPMSYSLFDYGMRYNSATAIGIKNPLYTDATALKQAMSGVQLFYELATPTTIQLTPTPVKSLLGVNNIWTDTGNIELTYLTNNPLTQTVYDMVKILVEQST